MRKKPHKNFNFGQKLKEFERFGKQQFLGRMKVFCLAAILEIKILKNCPY
jgi:hypothetical protein